MTHRRTLPKDSVKIFEKPNPAQANCPVCECDVIEENEEKGIAGADDASLCEGKL